MTEEKNSSNSEEIKQLLEKNIELSEKILELTTKTGKYIFWQQVYSVVKILIILVPIILGILYLPALLENVLGQYKSLLQTGANFQGLGQLSTDLLKQVK